MALCLRSGFVPETLSMTRADAHVTFGNVDSLCRKHPLPDWPAEVVDGVVSSFESVDG